jgi:hypothetical protein
MSFYLSGSVGYTFLNNNDINVLLLADIHDGVKYCKENSKMIAKWLDENSEKYTILLEEVRGDYKLTDLWPDSIHTKELKQLNSINLNIIPVDIRPQLIPFSWELLDTNSIQINVLRKITLKIYLKYLENFFKNTLNANDIMKKNNISFTHKNTNNVSPEYHLSILKELFEEYKNMYIEIINKDIQYVRDNNPNALIRINNLISMCMEWYIIVLILHNSKNTIIHVGLAHSNRILDLLVQVYKFNIIEKTGINKLNEVNSEIPSACILISKNVNNMYNKKYGINYIE